MAQRVEDLLLSLQWLGSPLQRGFHPWPGNVHVPWVRLKGENQQGLLGGQIRCMQRSCAGVSLRGLDPKDVVRDVLEASCGPSWPRVACMRERGAASRVPTPRADQADGIQMTGKFSHGKRSSPCG